MTQGPHNPTRGKRLPLYLAAIALLTLAAWPVTKSHLEAIAVLQAVSGKPVPRLIAKLVTVPVTIQTSDFETPSGKVHATLYVPKGRPHAPALIVLHGVHHLGIEEPRLIAFARAMSACGIQVLTPELPGIKDYHVDPGSLKMIGESTQWFAHKTEAPVGVMGLSFSGGLALVAAADPAYKPSFKFVLAVGAQDSLPRVTEYFRTNEDPRPDGTIEHLPAHDYGPLVLEYEYVEDFVPTQDVDALRAVLRAHLYEDGQAEKQAVAALTPRQTLESKSLLNSTIPETQTKLAAAVQKHLEEMNTLSPAGRLKTMTTPVYLLHGEADNIIPSAETLWMASELPSSTLKAMLVSPVISHIEIGKNQPGLGDQWHLIHFLAQVMHAASVR